MYICGHPFLLCCWLLVLYEFISNHRDSVVQMHIIAIDGTQNIDLFFVRTADSYVIRFRASDVYFQI